MSGLHGSEHGAQWNVLPDRDQVGPGRTDFYVACLDEDSSERTLKTARTLRAYGDVEVDTSLRGLKKQLKAAEKKGARVVVIVENDSRDELKWKDMDQRTQEDIKDDGLAARAEAFVRGVGADDR